MAMDGRGRWDDGFEKSSGSWPDGSTEFGRESEWALRVAISLTGESAVPSDGVDAFPVSTIAPDEILPRASFALKTAKPSLPPHFEIERS
jgi:hypothetical protein